MLEIKKVARRSKGDGKPAPRITESDQYVAHLVKIEKFKSKKHPEWDESFRFIFRVLQEPFVGGFASGITPSMWVEDGKLDTWLKALGVEQAREDDKLNVNELRGQLVRILVKVTNDGFANVTELFPMRDKDQDLIAPGALDNQRNFKKRTDNDSSDKAAAKSEAATVDEAQEAEADKAVSDNDEASVEPSDSIDQDDSIPF